MKTLVPFATWCGTWVVRSSSLSISFLIPSMTQNSMSAKLAWITSHSRAPIALRLRTGGFR